MFQTCFNMKHLSCQRTSLIYRQVVATLTLIKINDTINMKGSKHDHHLLFPSSPSTKQNEKWDMTTVSPLPSLEAGLGKVVKFWAEDFTANPNSCIPRGWVGKEPLDVKTVTQAAGVFSSYSLNPTMLRLFLLHALIELRIICSVLKFLVLVQTGIILLFRYSPAGGWAGRQGASLFAYLAALLWVIFIDWKLGKANIFSW